MKAIGGTPPPDPPHLPAHRAAARRARRACIGVGARASCSPTRSSAFFGSSFFAHLRPASPSTSGGASSSASLVGLLGAAAGGAARDPPRRRGSRLARRCRRAARAVGGQGRSTARCGASRFLPRTAQIGLRSVGRRKRRSARHRAPDRARRRHAAGAARARQRPSATMTREFWNDAHYDICAGTVASKPFNADATSVDQVDAGRRAQSSRG